MFSVAEDAHTPNEMRLNRKSLRTKEAFTAQLNPPHWLLYSDAKLQPEKCS